MSVLIVLIGLPASGKSTFALKFKEILQKNTEEKNRILSRLNPSDLSFLTHFSSINIVDTDKIRENIYGFEFNSEEESDVRNQYLLKIEEFLEFPNSIVIADDLNYYESMRHLLREIIKNKNGLYFPIYFKIPLNICIERNNARGNPIPNSLIENISDKIDRPGNKYKWDQYRLKFTNDGSSLNDMIIKTIEKIIDSFHNRLENENNQGNNSITKKTSIKSKRDKHSREIISLIIQDKISFDDNKKLHELLSICLNDYICDKGRSLHKVRKSYLKWLNENDIKDLSLSQFFEFLKYQKNTKSTKRQKN